MVGFACAENKNSVLAFSAIDDKIVIIKDTKGNTYLPSYGSNGISDFQRGYGYPIKVTEEGRQLQSLQIKSTILSVLFFNSLQLE
jgi:hypothetical protein